MTDEGVVIPLDVRSISVSKLLDALEALVQGAATMVRDDSDRVVEGDTLPNWMILSLPNRRHFVIPVRGRDALALANLMYKQKKLDPSFCTAENKRRFLEIGATLYNEVIKPGERKA